MTLVDRQALSVGWQTWAVLFATVMVGRWQAGGGFGYTLFALVWAPMAALFGRAEQARRVAWLTTVSMVGLFALPWWIEGPGLAAVRLTGWLTLFIGTVIGVHRAFVMIRLPALTASGLTILLWASWLTVPLLMAGETRQLIGDSWLAGLLVVHPVLLMNAADVTAGDWTHQNIAYGHLTRLGQDIPFGWGGSGWGLGLYGIVGAAGLIVPRGTIQGEKTIAADRGGHAETSMPNHTADEPGSRQPSPLVRDRLGHDGEGRRLH